MSHSTPPRSLLAVVLAATMFVGAACGTSGSDDTASTTTIAADGGETPTTAAGGEETTTTSGADPTPTTDDVPDTTDGSEGEPGDRQAYIDAFAAGFDDEEEPIFEPGQVQCLAEGYLDVIGFDNIVAAGVTPEQFGEGEDFPEELGLDESMANELYDQFGSCDIDLKALFVDVFSGFSPEPLTDEQQSCIDDTLTDERLRESFVTDLLGLEEEGADPFEELESCVPDSFGADAEIDSGPTADTIAPRN